MDLEALKEEVRARADVVDIIGRVVHLKKAGESWKGLCPFHQEKTPSFTVNPRRQSYHCFGCGAGGDVFKFVMEYDRLDFMAALERLASQTGVPFEIDGRDGGGAALRRRLLELHERTAAHFQEILKKAAEGEGARVYLKSRELSSETAETYRLGCAPDAFDHLLRLGREWGFSEPELEQSGLFGLREEDRGGDRLYDRFRNRLIFPILDEQSRVIGFSGRVIPPGESRAKYLNSPETLLFKKSRVLYGIDKARRAMTEARQAVLCEGQLDVIRCHESGIGGAVAAQGTAVTEQHAQILKRYADEVVLLLDADEAGVKAALRSGEILIAEGITVRVAALPEGEDPDDVVRRRGPAKLRELVEAAESLVVFQVRTLVKQEGEITESGRMRVARAVMETIAKAREAVHREELVRQAAEALGMREDALREDLRESVSRQPPPGGHAAGGSRRAPAAALQLPSLEEAPPPAERMLLELLWAYPAGLDTARACLQPEHLRHPETRDRLRMLYGAASATREALLDLSREHPDGGALTALEGKWGREHPVDRDLESALRDLVMLLRREAMGRTRRAMQSAPARAGAAELEAELWRITTQENQLKQCAAVGDWARARALLALIDQQN